MLSVGLTGGIGAGKSTVAARLVEHGAVLVDADRLARQVVEPGSAGLASVVAEFGAEVLDGAGALDRTRLAQLVFADPSARARLEAIVHPLVRAATEQLTAAAPTDAVVVNDVPLLVETGLAATYHLVVVVEAEVGLRRERLVRRGLSEDAARARIAAQATDAQRRAAADVLLDNSADRERLLAAVDELWTGRLLDFERRLRRREPVCRSQRLVEPDPSWPAQYERVANRIRQGLRDRFIRLDHVGSTAVPGLVAADVLDIQLVVEDLAVADELAGVLARLGLPRVAGDWYDCVPGDDRQVRSVKRLHGSADPGRVLQVHVREVSSPAWRWALLCRDWLRAVPAARSDYDAAKRELAGRELPVAQYAEQKDAWWVAGVARAQEWARATSWTA